MPWENVYAFPAQDGTFQSIKRRDSNLNIWQGIYSRREQAGLICISGMPQCAQGAFESHIILNALDAVVPPSALSTLTLVLSILMIYLQSLNKGLAGVRHPFSMHAIYLTPEIKSLLALFS
jgi:hypothetical protein